VRVLLFRYFSLTALLSEVHARHNICPVSPGLADAQDLIARQYGYASWPKLKQRVYELAGNSDALAELVGL